MSATRRADLADGYEAGRRSMHHDPDPLGSAADERRLAEAWADGRLRGGSFYASSEEFLSSLGERGVG